MTTLTVGAASVTQLTELAVWPIAPRRWYPMISDEQLALARGSYTPLAVSNDGADLIFSIHNYIVELAGTVIVIDTCSGNHKNRPLFPDLHMLDTDYLIRLKKAGYDPEDVDLVVNTHLHADHCGWNTRLKDGAWWPTFPNATYLFRSEELDYIAGQWNSAPVDQWNDNGGWVYQDSVLPVVERGRHRIIDVGEVIWASGSTRVTAIDAAGHTPGHVAIQIGTWDDAVLIVGDALHHPMQAQFPDLPFFADTDPEQAIATRRALLGRCADEGVKLLTAHFPVHVPLGVSRNGDGFRWVDFPAGA